MPICRSMFAAFLMTLTATAVSAADVCQVLWSGADDAQVTAITETIALTEGSAVVGETFTTEAVGKVMLQIVGGCDNIAALPGSNRTPAGFAAFALRMAGMAAPGEYPETVSVEDFSAQLRGNGFPLMWGGVIVRKPVTLAEAAAALDTLRGDIEDYKRTTDANMLAFSEGQAVLQDRVSELEKLGQDVADEKAQLAGQAQALEDLQNNIAIWRQADEVEAAAQNKAIADNVAAVGQLQERTTAVEERQSSFVTKEELAAQFKAAGLQTENGVPVSVSDVFDARLLALGLTIENGQVVLPAPPEYNLDKALADRGFTFADGKVVLPAGMTIEGLRALGFTFENGKVVLPAAGLSFWWRVAIALLALASLVALGAAWWLRRDVNQQTETIKNITADTKQANHNVASVLVTLHGDGSDKNPGLAATVAKQDERLVAVKAVATEALHKVSRLDFGDSIANFLAKVRAAHFDKEQSGIIEVNGEGFLVTAIKDATDQVRCTGGVRDMSPNDVMTIDGLGTALKRAAKNGRLTEPTSPSAIAAE